MIEKIAEMLREEGYSVTYAKDENEEFLQVLCVDATIDYQVTYIRNIFFNKNFNVKEMSFMFLDICNENLLPEIKKTSKKIKNLIKEFNQNKE